MVTKQNIPAYFAPKRVLARGEDYLYLLPHPALQPWISNYTVTFPSRSSISDAYTVIPHGSATLVLAAGAQGISASLFGPATAPCTVGAQANLSALLFIIEFQPAGLFAFTGAAQKELADRTVPFGLLCPVLCARLAELLERARSVYELADGADALLLSNLRGTCPPALPSSIQTVIARGGNLSMAELSGSVFYSERHLARLFDAYLGLSAKTFSRLVRVNRAVRLLGNSHCSLTRACCLSGYYDFSHFARDFKAVCGLTPQQYRGRMSDFYSEIAKF